MNSEYVKYSKSNLLLQFIFSTGSNSHFLLMEPIFKWELKILNLRPNKLGNEEKWVSCLIMSLFVSNLTFGFQKGNLASQI